MFGRVARRYDLLNHLLSFNLDKSWRARTVERVQPGSAAARRSRSGSVLRHRRRAAGAPSAAMEPAPCWAAISVIPCWWKPGAKSPRSAGAPLFEADALALPLREASLDLIAVAFGFRNLANYREGS